MNNQVCNDMMRNICQSSSRQYQYPMGTQAAMNNAITGISRYTAAQMSSMAAAAAVSGSSYMHGQFSNMQNQSGVTTNNFQDHFLHYQTY
jgi:hypothetical protein